MKIKIILVNIVLSLVNLSSIQAVNIGLIYDEINPNVEKIFLKAIEDANEKYPNLGLTGISALIEYGNEFDTSDKLCSILEQSVATVFGAVTPSSAEHIFNICDEKEIPYIDTIWDSYAELPGLTLHPDIEEISAALRDMVESYEWDHFTILYESGFYLPLVKAIIEEYEAEGPKITVRRYDLDLNDNYKDVLRKVKWSEETRIIVVGSTEKLYELLIQAQQIGLVTDPYEIIIGDLDFQTIDMEPFQYSEVNITGYRLFSQQDEKLIGLQKVLCNNFVSSEYLNASCTIPVAEALIYDGVHMLAKTLENMKIETQPIQCSNGDAWKDGLTLINHFKAITLEGITGMIEFDEENYRTNFKLEAIELTSFGFIKIGKWSPEDKFKLDRVLFVEDEDSIKLSDETFIVITANSPPYGMLKETPDKLVGNDRYEGYGIELIAELSKTLGFKYEFRIQEDGNYGSLDKDTQEWDGMMLELLEGRADLAITDLTMTADREKAVDFTLQFMSLGIAILFRKPQKQPPELFSFMSPFSQEVWVFVGIGYLSVSISLFILGRLSADEWDNPFPDADEPTHFENQFTFGNCLWFTIGALLQAGSDVSPKATSTRVVASIWTFFTLIMVSSYTANLAAFLTVEVLVSPITNVEDLAKNLGNVKYGAKIGGSTFKFFQASNYSTYKTMYEYMTNHPELMTKNNPEGVAKAQDENQNYAFLMESTSLEYEIERKCNLTQVGKNLDEKGYAIAMRKNWPYRNKFSKAILQMQEQGQLDKMKVKWWKEKRGGGACQASSDSDAQPLDMPNLAGVYFVVLVGCAFALCYGTLEWIYFMYRTWKRTKMPLKIIFSEEFKSVLNLTATTKTVRGSRRTSRSGKLSVTNDSIEEKNEDSKTVLSKISKKFVK